MEDSRPEWPRVAFQGEAGAFSEDAALAFFGGRAVAVPRRDFEAVGAAVAEGAVEYGVLPVENSLAGSVVAAYDILSRGRLTIVGEVVRPIRHCLLGVPGAEPAEVRRIISHPVALAQCTRFLAVGSAEAVAVYDTAGAAREVAERGDPTLAAVAGRCAAERYGLAVLADGIQDRQDNQTRFFLVAAASARPVPSAPTDARKMVILLETEDRPGALVGALVPFALNGINLTRLESRPADRPWRYRFFLELSADAADPAAARAIEEARDRALSLRLLGSFACRPAGAA